MNAVVAKDEVSPSAYLEAHPIESQVGGQAAKVRFGVMLSVDEQQAVLEGQAVSGQSDDALDPPAGAAIAGRVYHDYLAPARRAAGFADEKQVAVVEGTAPCSRLLRRIATARME